VVQVYVEPGKAAVERPMRELKGFAKVRLAAAESRTVTIPLDLGALAYFDSAKHAWVAEAGEYTILVGDSSRNLPLKATYKLAETITIREGP
jgi:beta-glucosidase